MTTSSKMKKKIHCMCETISTNMAATKSIKLTVH